MRYPKTRNRPVKRIAFDSAAHIYKDDYDFLKVRKIPISWAVRQAMQEYVLILRSREHGKPFLHDMGKAEKDHWILSAKDDFKPEPKPTPAAAVLEISHDPAPDMNTWTKKERDAWILDEKIPDRVMMARRQAGTQILTAPRV